MATPPKLLPSDIQTEQFVVHPALDWREGILLVGVTLVEGERGVLTSRGEILSISQLPFPCCERSQSFSRSPITENVARRFQEGYGTPENAESAYALVDVPVRLAEYYRRFVVFPTPWWSELLALWTLGTYLYPVFTTYPYLRISSPEPGCGKSLLGELIASLSFNGDLMVSPTEANIFRIAESERGTQVWDEVENQNAIDQSRLQMMSGVLLHGYRSGGMVPRQERGKAGRFVTIRYHVYVPRVLIGLSELPPVVQQRSIELILHRRSRDEQIERYRPEQQVRQELKLREECALWALSHCQAASHQYGRNDLVQYLEKEVSQAGRLVDDILLPLAAVCAAPIDQDERSRGVLMPLLRRMVSEAAPMLTGAWKENSTTTPLWLSAALEVLETAGETTPADLAAQVEKRTGLKLTPERLSHRLAKYGIRSEKKAGKRVMSVSQVRIDQLRAKYGISVPDLTPEVIPLDGLDRLDSKKKQDEAEESSQHG